MYERGERKPRHSLREEDQGVGYLEGEESLEDRMGYYGKGAHRRRLHHAHAHTMTHAPHSSHATRTGARKGFAAMPRERVREIAAKGGRHSHGFKSKARWVQ